MPLGDAKLTTGLTTANTTIILLDSIGWGSMRTCWANHLRESSLAGQHSGDTQSGPGPSQYPFHQAEPSPDEG